MLEHPRLRVGAVQDGHLIARGACAHEFANLLDDETRFIHVGKGLEDADRFAGAGFGPQVLAEAAAILFDQRIGGVEDVAVRAIVLFQANHVRQFEFALQVAHVADLGAAEGVDRLVVVADAEHVARGAHEGSFSQAYCRRLVS